jgi:hypothetical protein
MPKVSRRHARPCAGHPRISGKDKIVDGRDKPGHDGIDFYFDPFKDVGVFA